LGQVVVAPILLLQAEFQRVVKVVLADLLLAEAPVLQITEVVEVEVQHNLAEMAHQIMQAAAVMAEHLIFLVQ
jgi:hypothetical protein